MSTTSTRFGLKVPDGTDSFDNDQYLKGNLNIIDQKAALVSDTVAAEGQKVEIVEVSLVSSGSTSSISGSGTFTKTYTIVPTILPGVVTQTVGYVDSMCYPFVSSPTLTGFQVKLVTSNTVNNFGAGTVKMTFLVFGK